MRLKIFFKDWSNFLAFAIGLIPTVLLYIFPSSASVPFAAFVVLLFLFLLALWLCCKLFLDSKDTEQVSKIPIIECSHGVCICKTNDFISYNSVVSFYEKSGNYEHLIGYGLVSDIIAGKTALIKTFSNTAEITNLLIYINDHQSNIIIRPTITADTLDYLSNFINH